MGSIHLALIKWDQKLGGVVETIEPSLTITPNTAMNMYNLHRMRQTGPSYGILRIKLEKGEQFNTATFFTGFGGTSPDGFTANYGKNVIGISERVIALFLPLNVKAQSYEEILAKISARVVLDQNKTADRIKKIHEILEKSGLISKPDELYEFLEKYLDRQLGLSEQEIVQAALFEVKALHFLVAEKNEHIKELTINPASMAFCDEGDKISQAQAQKDELKDLLQQIQNLSTQKDMTAAISQQKDEMIETLKADYIKIFGTLTDQILQLENEIKGISESTQAFVNDLNQALAEKIARIQELEAEIAELKARQ